MAEEEKQAVSGSGSLTAGSYDDTEDVFGGYEEWTPTETKLVVWSFAAAAVCLVIGGILVNVYILK